MGYLQALNLLIRTYKATKGYLPKGLDMLKLKMKARQKVIDSKKVIKFPQGGKDKINPFEPRPKFPKNKEGIEKLIKKGDVKIGQAPKTTKRKPAVDPKLTQEENIKRIMAENKAAAKRLQEKMNKPEKTLGEKLKDYKGDPDAMRDGGKVKRRKKGEPADQVIEEETQTEYFLDKMPRPKRSDGIISLATGGMTNISDTYDNNPTLQSQYPNKQDYLDMFAQQTTTTTPQTDTITQSTTSTIAPINPIKPIIPLPQDSGGDGGNLPPGGGITAGINFDYGYTSPGGEFNLDDIGEGTVADEDYTLGMRARDALSGIQQVGQGIYSAISPIQMAKRAKDAFDDMRSKRAAEIIEQIRREEEARLQAQLNRPRVPGGTIDSGNQGSGGYGGTGGEGPSAVGSSGMLGGGV